MESLPAILQSYSWHQCHRFICLAVKVPGLPDMEASCVSCEFSADTFKLKVCPVKQKQNSVIATSCGDNHNPNGIARKLKVGSRSFGTQDKCAVSYVLFINNLARKVNPDGCSYRIKTDEVRVNLAKLVPDEEWLAVTATESKEHCRQAFNKRIFYEANKEQTRMLEEMASTPASFLVDYLSFCNRIREEVVDVEKSQQSGPSNVLSSWTVTRPCDLQPAVCSFHYRDPELVRMAIRKEHAMTVEFHTLLNVAAQFRCSVLLRCLDSFLGCHESAYAVDYGRLKMIMFQCRTRLLEFWGCLKKEHISFLPDGLRRLGLSVRSKRDYDLLLELRPFPNLDSIDLMVQRSVAPANLRALPARYKALTLHFHGLADHDMEWMIIVLTRVADKRKPSLRLHASLLTATGARVLARRLSNFHLTDIRIEAALLSLADRGQVEKLFAEKTVCPCFWSIDLLWGKE